MSNTANFPTRMPVRKTIGGVEYVAQFNGVGFALDTVDNSYIQGSNNISARKMAQQIFDHVIVEPKGLTPDSFDDLDVFNEVVKFGREVMQGKIRAANGGEFREPATNQASDSAVSAQPVESVAPRIE